MGEAQRALWAFLGVESLALLLVGYLCFETGLAMVKALRAGKRSLTFCQIVFALPATLLAFIPVVVLGFWMRLQPAGKNLPFSVEDPNFIFVVFRAALLGLVLESIALGFFWYFTRETKAAPAQQPTTTPEPPKAEG